MLSVIWMQLTVFYLDLLLCICVSPIVLSIKCTYADDQLSESQAPTKVKLIQGMLYCLLTVFNASFWCDRISGAFMSWKLHNDFIWMITVFFHILLTSTSHHEFTNIFIGCSSKLWQENVLFSLVCVFTDSSDLSFSTSCPSLFLLPNFGPLVKISLRIMQDHLFSFLSVWNILTNWHQFCRTVKSWVYRYCFWYKFIKSERF